MANEIKNAFDSAFRDYVTDGVPSSGVHSPQKSAIRSAGQVVQSQVDAVAASVSDVADSAAADVVAEAAVRAAADTALQASIDAAAATFLTGQKPLIGSVRVLTTANTATSTAMENGDTLDGVTLATGDRVGKAYNGATGDASNGIWIVQASGAAVRATDANTDAELRNGSFYVDAGTYQGQLWAIKNTSAITVDTTAIVIEKARDAVGYEAEVIAARGSSASLNARLDGITANDVPDTPTTDTPTLLRTTSALDTALVRYDVPSRGLIAPGADRPHAGGPIEIFIGFGQSKMANRTAVPPINTVIRRPFRSLMFTEVGTMGIGTDDITTFDLSKIGPARAFEGDSLEGESYWNSFAYQLLAREDEAKLAPAAKFFFNCSLGGTDILTLTARKYATWSALNAAPGTLAGEIATVPTTDAGTHTDPVVGGTVANSGTFRWSASPAGWERTGSTVQNMYANMIAGVNYLYKHFRGNVVVRCVLCDQGESNEADSQATYTTYVQRAYDMLEADLQAINAGIFGYYADGTAKRLPMLWNHTPIRNTESTVGAGYGWGTQDALVALDVTARTSPLTARRIVVGCSAYDRPYVDTSHYNVHGTILKGADLAEAFWMLENNGWSNAGTIKMTAAVVDGSDILVTTSALTPLTIETNPPYRNWSSTTAGFALRDGSDVAVAITSVAIDAVTTKIRITPASAPSAGWKVLAGRKATVLTNPGPGAGTNIRTTSTAVCELRPDRPLHQFLLGSEITVS